MEPVSWCFWVVPPEQKLKAALALILPIESPKLPIGSKAVSLPPSLREKVQNQKTMPNGSTACLG